MYVEVTGHRSEMYVMRLASVDEFHLIERHWEADLNSDAHEIVVFS